MLDQDCSVAWGDYWGEPQSVGFISLLAAKVMTNEISLNIIIIDD